MPIVSLNMVCRELHPAALLISSINSPLISASLVDADLAECEE